MDPSTWIFEPFRWLWSMINDRPVVVVICIAAFAVAIIMAADLLSDHDDTTS